MKDINPKFIGFWAMIVLCISAVIAAFIFQNAGVFMLSWVFMIIAMFFCDVDYRSV